MICNLCVFLFSLSTDDDCTDSCESLNNRSYNNNNTAALSSGKSQSLTSSPAKMISDRINEDGLILPKKLHNPCADSSDRQSLHRELLFNQKMWVRSIHHHNVWQFLTKLCFQSVAARMCWTKKPSCNEPWRSKKNVSWLLLKMKLKKTAQLRHCTASWEKSSWSVLKRRRRAIKAISIATTRMITSTRSTSKLVPTCIAFRPNTHDSLLRASQCMLKQLQCHNEFELLLALPPLFTSTRIYIDLNCFYLLKCRFWSWKKKYATHSQILCF